MRRPARLAFTVAVAIGVAACAGSPEAPTDTRAAAAQRTPVYRLAQLSYAGRAVFGVCVEPACPAVTRKTIAGSRALPVATPASAAAATPSAGVPSPAAAPVTTATVPAAAPTPAPLPVAIADGLSTKHLTVTFAPGSAELSAEARSALRGSIADARRAERIVISGRTDSTGEPKANEALALARAVSVRDFLREQAPDLADGAIQIQSKGRCCFVASNDTQEGRSKNRRVGVFFVSREGA